MGGNAADEETSKRAIRMYCGVCFDTFTRARSCIHARDILDSWDEYKPLARQEAEKLGNEDFLRHCGVDCAEARKYI